MQLTHSIFQNPTKNPSDVTSNLPQNLLDENFAHESGSTSEENVDALVELIDRSAAVHHCSDDRIAEHAVRVVDAIPLF